MTGADFANHKQGNGNPESTAAREGERRDPTSASTGTRSKGGRPPFLLWGPCPYLAAPMALTARPMGRSQNLVISGRPCRARAACSTPLPVFPSYRTASWFWPSQGHHPRSSRRQSGQSRPGTPPSRSSAAEDPAGSGQPAACSPAGLPTLPGGESVSARPRGTTARAGDTQARVTLNRLLDQLSAAADPVGPCQSALFPPGRGLKRGTPVLLSLPPSIIAAGPQRGAAGRGHPAAAPLPRAGQKAAPSL